MRSAAYKSGRAWDGERFHSLARRVGGVLLMLGSGLLYLAISPFLLLRGLYRVMLGVGVFVITLPIVLVGVLFVVLLFGLIAGGIGDWSMAKHDPAVKLQETQQLLAWKRSAQAERQRFLARTKTAPAEGDAHMAADIRADESKVAQLRKELVEYQHTHPKGGT